MLTDRVAAAFRAVPRAGFLPVPIRRRASYDGPLEIGHGQTNSQPRTVADMLRLLDVGPGHAVLDIGSGSGWTTALLAWLVGESGSVLGLEIVPELVEVGAANLAATAQPWARIEPARDGVVGDPGRRYDRILVSAEAAELPADLLQQLAPDGVIVAPVDGVMLRVTPDETTQHGRYRFVPLR